jgi:hypothetical protein
MLAYSDGTCCENTSNNICNNNNNNNSNNNAAPMFFFISQYFKFLYADRHWRYVCKRPEAELRVFDTDSIAGGNT